MLKKIIKVFFFFAFLQVIVYSCCDDEYYVYYNSITFNAIDTLDADSSTVTSENLVLDINFDYDFVLAAYFKPLKQLSNSAYATSCDEDYSLRDIADNVIITTNIELFGIEAGNPINNYLYFINPYTLERENVEGLISYLNTTNNYGSDPINLIFREELPSEITLTVSIKLNMLDRMSLNSTTEAITIE